MKAIMYHYVREYDHHSPHFRFLDVSNFRKQLDFFEKEYGFVQRQDWEDFVDGKPSQPLSKGVVLTFDDAMSCHYDFVFQELKERGLWGIFYASTYPFRTGKILDVHRIHLLCGRISGVELFDISNKMISEEQLCLDKLDEFKGFTYTKQKNYEGVTEFKRLLNYFLQEQYKTSILDQLMAHFQFDLPEREYYASPGQLAEMSNEGMVIGSHTDNHPVMSKLDKTTQELEISQSFEFLESICSMEYRTYCHPYGGFHTFNKDTLDALKEENVKYSFNVESRDIVESDIDVNNQMLPRYDCNQFNFGKAS